MLDTSSKSDERDSAKLVIVLLCLLRGSPISVFPFLSRARYWDIGSDEVSVASDPTSSHYVFLYSCVFVCVLYVAYIRARRLNLIPSYVLRVPWAHTVDAQSYKSTSKHTEFQSLPS